MMRNGFTASLLLVGLGAGCSWFSDDVQSDRDPMSPRPAPAPMAAPAEAPAPRTQAAGNEWEALLTKLKSSYTVGESQRSSQADEHYRLAERYYVAGDFEKSAEECEKAVQLNPNHAPARSLFIEVQFILGRGKATPVSEEHDKYVKEAIVRHQQLLVEIDQAYERGTRSYNLGEYEQAEREFRKILEFAKWMPTGIDLETRRKGSLDMLERTKASKRQRELDEEKSRMRLIEEEKARDEFKRLIDQKRELELLFGQAQMMFEREEYPRCVEICDKILYINPNLTSVAEMRNVAQRLQHIKRGRDNLRNYIEEWKRTFEQIEINSMVQANELLFPSMEIWKEKIAKRQPKGIAEIDDQISDEDKTILDKLRSIRITIDMQAAPLPQVIDYIREISGLNIHITGVDAPEGQEVTFKVQDIVLEGALKLMLGPLNLSFDVREGVVIIMPGDQLKKAVKLELYDVQDLTYGVADFPGVDISLATDAIGTAVIGGEEAQQQFTGEDLASLIQNTIRKDQWEEADGRSIQFQNGLLIVRNSVEMHRSIRKFLSELRASTSLLVSVETRFLSVEDSFLHQVGMDFRDVNGSRVQGIRVLNDINQGFTLPNFPTFVDPGNGLQANTAGITGVFGDNVQRSMGIRVQQIMNNDFLVNRFFDSVLRPTGGATLQYTLLDDISLEIILRLVSRSERNHMLTAPKLTLFNTQRGNFRISNQMAYVRDYDVQIATAAVALDPIVDVVSDGISLDVRPVVSADRRFVTLELRPTIATLFPPPPDIFTIITNVTVPGAPITDALPVTIETPIINIQRIRTTVVVPDKGTLMLGGLTTYFDENAETSIPMWRNLPILGVFGSNRVKGLQRKQTLIICKVRIIIPGEEERRLF